MRRPRNKEVAKLEDGISINIATSVITALSGGGIGAVLMHFFGGRRQKPARDCANCPAHHELERRVVELEKDGARQAGILESIDKRLAQLNDFMTNNFLNIMMKKG